MSVYVAVCASVPVCVCVFGRIVAKNLIQKKVFSLDSGCFAGKGFCF